MAQHTPSSDAARSGDMPTAFVLGLFDTGLAVLRSLGRRGVPVRGFDADAALPGFASRYGTHQRCPSPVTEPEALVAMLVKEAERTGGPVLLFPTSDPFVSFVSEHREALAPACEHVLPDHDTVAAILDKGRQHDLAVRLGIPVPDTHEPRTMEEVVALAPALEYPVFLKPSIGHVWRAEFEATKGIEASDEAELVSAFERIFAAGQRALVQSLIVGPNPNHVKVCAYMTPDGRPIAALCLRKIRQYPSDFGAGSLVESIEDPELLALGLRVFEGFGWRGPGSIEFKRDARDGRLRMIELNPRLWQQNALAERCGLSYPWIQYETWRGREPLLPDPLIGVRWLDEPRDLLSAWEQRRRGELTVRRWLNSWRGVRVGALFAPDDPGPALATLARYARHGAGGTLPPKMALMPRRR